MITAHVKLPPDMHKAIKAAAQQEQRTMHNMILKIIRQWLSEKRGLNGRGGRQ